MKCKGKNLKLKIQKNEVCAREGETEIERECINRAANNLAEKSDVKCWIIIVKIFHKTCVTKYSISGYWSYIVAYFIPCFVTVRTKSLFSALEQSLKLMNNCCFSTIINYSILQKQNHIRQCVLRLISMKSIVVGTYGYIFSLIFFVFGDGCEQNQ